MNYSLTCKGFEKTPEFEKLIERKIAKVEKVLSNFIFDVPRVSIVIKKHEKNHFFSGLLTLYLPKKPLIVTVSGHHEEELLQNGFDTLFREFEKYKAKHFKGSSKYRDHISTISESKGGEVL